MANLGKLVTRLTTITEFKQIMSEILMNNTSRVSKITNESVVNGYIYGIAKTAQKFNKDVAILESQIIPELASGSDLDSAALLNGGLERLGATGSSTFIRVKADVGTQYTPGVHNFVSRAGVQFEITEFVTVGANGFAYIPARSLNVGETTNVDAQTINTVTPVPTGHDSATNEYMAVGGRDEENDESYKIRIRSFPNLQARQTLEYILEVIKLFNENALRLLNVGLIDNRTNLRIVLENGVFLTDSELSELVTNITPYLQLTDVSQFGSNIGLDLFNVVWKNIDIDFRIEIDPAFIVDDVRRNAQIAITKYMDFRYWDENQQVEWDDLLSIVKNVDGARYVPDEFFTPNADIQVGIGELPRVRSFIMRDLGGVILFDSTNNLTPVFYENGT